MDEHVFDNILINDEKIVKVYRPNKKRYLVVNILISSILILVIGFGLIISGVVGYSLMGFDNLEILLPLTLTGIAFIIVLIIYIVYISIIYNRTFYGYTDKRMLIRTGFIGADYKSLDIKSIGSVNVKVGLLDKSVKPVATGTIDFASPSSPFILDKSNHKISQFSFKSIDNPYVVYKEIKQYIDNIQENKKD